MLSMGLVGKVPRIIAHGTGSQTVTGTGSAIDMAPSLITIPAGLMGATSSVRITLTWKFTGGTGNRVVAIKFGATTIASTTHASTVLSATTINLYHNKTTLGVLSQVGYAGNIAAGIGASGVTVVTGSVDTTADVAVQVLFTGTGPDTASLEHYIVEVLP